MNGADLQSRTTIATDARSSTPTPTPTDVQPSRSRLAAMFVLGTVSLSALGGGVYLVTHPTAAMPLGHLAGTPFTTWLLPGLALVLVNGAVPLAALVATWQRRWWAEAAQVGAGLLLLAWLVVQIPVVGYETRFQIPYTALAVSLLVLNRRSMSDAGTRLGYALIALGIGVATSAVLGPLVLGSLAYRTSPTSLNQIVGADAVGLAVVAPSSILAGLLVLQRRPGAPYLGLAPAIFAAYTYTQLIVGNEYLDRPGNVEVFFPLLLAVFVLAVWVAIAAWRASIRHPLKHPSRTTDRISGLALLGIATFVVVGLHLPSYLDALSDVPGNAGYLSSPTAFWLVKFMDLGIVVPAAVAVGVGMLRHRPWALRPMLAIVGGYALLGASVAGMAIVMYVTDDPDGSLAMVVSSAVAALMMIWLATYLYRTVLPAPGTRRGEGATIEAGSPAGGLQVSGTAVEDEQAFRRAGLGGDVPRGG